MSTLLFAIDFVLCAICISALIYSIKLKIKKRMIIAFSIISICEAFLTFFAVRSEVIPSYLPNVKIRSIVAIIFAIYEIAYVVNYRFNRVSTASIRDAFDKTDVGLCYFTAKGKVVLCNEKMNSISRAMQKTNVLNGNEFVELINSHNSTTITLNDNWIVDFAVRKYNEKYTEIMAVDVTDRAKTIESLRLENEKIDASNRRIREYGLLLDEYVREKEILNAKIRIHDSFGGLLLSTQKVIKENDYDSVSELVQGWKNNLDLLSVRTQETPLNLIDDLIETANKIGVKINIDGAIPDDDKALDIIALSIRECLTNCVMHADSHNLFVSLESKNDSHNITIKNDGNQPKNEIKEGGGLSMLRKKVSLANGTMNIDSVPEFKLSITIPKEEKQNAK